METKNTTIILILDQAKPAGERTNGTKINKQLLDEVEHDIMNYQNRGQCYLPKPKAGTNKNDENNNS